MVGGRSIHMKPAAFWGSLSAKLRIAEIVRIATDELESERDQDTGERSRPGDIS